MIRGRIGPTETREGRSPSATRIMAVTANGAAMCLGPAGETPADIPVVSSSSWSTLSTSGSEAVTLAVPQSLGRRAQTRLAPRRAAEASAVRAGSVRLPRHRNNRQIDVWQVTIDCRLSRENQFTVPEQNVWITVCRRPHLPSLSSDRERFERGTRRLMERADGRRFMVRLAPSPKTRSRSTKRDIR